MPDGRVTIETALDETGIKKGLTGLNNTITSGLKSAVKGFAVLTTATASATGAIVKGAVSAYAEYEQLVGGIETLFKDNAEELIRYAEVSYKTAGVSANKYMELSTSFSASLIQSLEGDTKKAVEYSNMAIIDMSDNTNKMGTNIESIQNAYQGFAKGNFTMLDNLKLGYGGTKSEMERLLKTAQKLNEEQGIYKEYSIDSFSDIVDAIHVVQTQLDITGTTAKEAESTISGSFGMVKASWSDLLVGMANGSSDMDRLLGNFMTSVKTFAGNVLPVIKQALAGVGRVVREIAPEISKAIPKLITDVLPELIEGGTSMALALIDGIVECIPQIVKVAPIILSGLLSALKDVAKKLPNLLGGLFGKTGERIGKELTTAFSKAFDVFTDLGKKIIPILTNALEFLADHFEIITSTVLSVVIAMKTLSIINTIIGFVKGAVTAFQTLNAVMLANPYAAVAVGIGTIVGALFISSTAFKDNTEYISENTEKAREELEVAKDLNNAYKEQKQALEEKISSEIASIDNAQVLWEELQSLADAQGNVSDKDKARAQFIVDELNKALDTEISLTDNQIDNYNELVDSIKQVIETKKAEIYLSAYEEEYAEAIKNVAELKKKTAEQSYQLTNDEIQREKLYTEQSKLYSTKRANGWTEEQEARAEAIKQEINDLDNRIIAEEGAYNNNLQVLSGYYDDINAYEQASIAMQQGNTKEVIDILDNKSQAYLKSADIAGKATAEEKAQFKAQAEEATRTYALFREQYEAGNKAFTQEMVKDAEEKMRYAWSEYTKVGGTMVDAMSEGAWSNNSTLNESIKGIIADAITGGIDTAEAVAQASRNAVNKRSNYGSRYTKTARGGVVEKGQLAFLEGDGTEAVVPLENNYKWINKVSRDMLSAMTDKAQTFGTASSGGGTVLNFYDTQTSPDAIYQKFITNQEFGLARAF